MCAYKHTQRRERESSLSTAAPASRHQYLCYKQKPGHSMPVPRPLWGLNLDLSPVRSVSRSPGCSPWAIRVGLFIKCGVGCFSRKGGKNWNASRGPWLTQPEAGIPGKTRHRCQFQVKGKSCQRPSPVDGTKASRGLQIHRAR